MNYYNYAQTAGEGAFHRAMRVRPSTEIKPRPVYSAFKRSFDLVISLAALAVAAIPMLIIALAIAIDSEGSVIFAQERLGLDGKPFVMYKFRSMRPDAERDGPRWAERYDNRVTRFGRFLRATRLDELPQIINILKGDMSLVGPRPERLYFYESFEERIPGFSRRLAVKPGLTGWAQINGGYELRPPEKLVYDIEYIASRSIAMDVKCMFLTLKVVFAREGAR